MVSLETLCRKARRKVHGRPIWVRSSKDGPLEELRFDWDLKIPISPELFSALQRKRKKKKREERRAGRLDKYSTGGVEKSSPLCL